MWISLAKEAAMKAGVAIMQVYDSMDFSVEYKSDQTPLTIADKTAHDIIQKKLTPTDLPILSEEGKMIPYEERKQWNYFWLVDPLDGTKEFIKRTKEFTVNIALIKENAPVMGIVYAPALELLYWSDFEGKAWKQQNDDPATKIYASKNAEIRSIVASKSHLTKETQEYINKFPAASLKTIGSSLKFMLVAEGTADCYPRFGSTMEWDTAAAHAIVNAAGGKVVYHDGDKPLTYNKKNLLNPWFIVSA